MRTFLGWVIAIAVIAGLYSVIMFGPIYLDSLDAKDIVNTTFNQYRDLGNAEGVKNELIRRFNIVAWAQHTEEDEYGQPKQVNGLGLTEDNVVVEFDDNTKVLYVKVTYDRVVVLKPTDKQRVFHFVIERREKPPNVF